MFNKYSVLGFTVLVVGALLLGACGNSTPAPLPVVTPILTPAPIRPVVTVPGWVEDKQKPQTVTFPVLMGQVVKVDAAKVARTYAFTKVLGGEEVAVVDIPLTDGCPHCWNWGIMRKETFADLRVAKNAGEQREIKATATEAYVIVQSYENFWITPEITGTLVVTSTYWWLD